MDTNTTEEMNLPDIYKTNCLRFDFENDGFLAIRPSGTEPKVKFYIETVGMNDEEGNKLAMKQADELKKIMGL